MTLIYKALTSLAKLIVLTGFIVGHIALFNHYQSEVALASGCEAEKARLELKLAAALIPESNLIDFSKNQWGALTQKLSKLNEEASTIEKLTKHFE